jgi:hypothetical protein
LLRLGHRKHLAGIGLVPAPVQVLGRHAKLDNKIARQVRRFDLAALLLPQPDERRLVVSQNNPGI